MLLFIDHATRYTDEDKLMYKSAGLDEFKEWKALREEKLGEQVK